MQTRAVLFDMDGVLVKSEEVWFRVVEAAGVQFRGSPVTREEFFPTFGQGTVADIPVFGFKCTAVELDAFYVTEFLEHLDAMWVNPDAKPLLTSLRAQGFATALATNTVGPLAQKILARADLTGLFDALGTSDRVPHAKPAPDILQLALRELGLQSSDAVMIGDSKFDRMAANAAGIRFIGLGIDGDVRIERLADVAKFV